ncbi:MAG: hypothetical protein Q8907_03920 [Bacteroidota bacterium]|nr:hypothetical protein [Bacteroidota bacterium]MDP4273407.1 hypothetical protein [Bacteroidota bacterium]
MKKLLLMGTMLCSCFFVFGQKPGPAKAAKDTIYRLGGKYILGEVINISPTEITYYDLFKQTQNIERKQIEKIIYRDGKIERYNEPLVKMIGENQWESVLTTENPNDIQGLYNRGNLIANSAPSTRSKKAAKESAIIRLKKKAVNVGASIVLITHQEAIGGYGEIPAYEIEGVAYGNEPLPEKKNNPAEETPANSIKDSQKGSK